MTKTQIRKKFRELKKSTNKSMGFLLEKALKSGALDIESFDDDFRLPKIIMASVCETMAWHWKPLTEQDKNEVKNLSLFL